MALDFPNSPVNGQQYNAPNGVMYIYSSANGLWMASGASTSSSTINATPPLNPYIGQLWWSPDLGQLFIYYFDGNSSQWVPATTSVAQQATAPGDFCATAIGQTFTSATAVAVPNTIVSGNSGGWYNSSNGRFTPPAGRYRIMASVFGYSASAVLTFSLNIRKNGTAINPGASASTAAANFWAQAAGDLTVDANGTDYFDFTVSSGSASTNPNCGITFSAIPVGVISYTTPAPGNLYLYSESVLTSAAATMDVTIPSNAKLVALDWAFTTTGGVNADARIVLMQSGTPNLAATYNVNGVYWVQSTPTGAFGYLAANAVGWSLSTASQCYGQMRYRVMPTNNWWGEGNTWNFNGTSRQYLSVGHDNVLAGVTGFRLLSNGGSPTFVAGSFLRCYVVQ